LVECSAWLNNNLYSPASGRQLKHNVKRKTEEKKYNLTDKKDASVYLHYNKLLQFAMDFDSNLAALLTLGKSKFKI